MSAAVPASAAATIDTEPTSVVRGSVLVLPGRGDTPAYYRRLATRLAFDGYRVRVATGEIASVDDVVAVWGRDDDGVRVVIGVDTSAGLLAAALAEGRLDPVPSGAVFAGAAVAGGSRPDADGELAVRSACPVFRGVVDAEPAAPLAASSVAAVWPDVPAAVPVLALHGERDAVAPAEEALARYAGWDAEVVTVREGLHDVLNDVHHRSVAAEIVVFLERLRSGGAPVLTRTTSR